MLKIVKLGKIACLTSSRFNKKKLILIFRYSLF